MTALDPIQVRRYGTHGPYVVLLHGGPGAPGTLAPVALALEDRDRPFRIIEPLQRRSGAAPLTVQRHVEDLHQVWGDIASGERVQLVGHSWGAMLALTYAARHPEGIDRVVLIGCGTFDQPSRGAYQAEMARRIEADPDTAARIEQLTASRARETNRQWREELFGELGIVLTRVQAFDTVDRIEHDLPCDERGHHETWADALLLQETGVQPAEFEHVAAPVIMIHGADDPHPGPMIRDSLKPYFRTLTYHEIPRCGHAPWLEREAAQEFFNVLEECLND